MTQSDPPQKPDDLLQAYRQLLAEAQALSSRIAAVNEIATAINKNLALDDILRVVGKQAKWVMDFEHCSVCLVNGEAYEIRVLFGPPLALTKSITVSALGIPIERALRTKQAQLVNEKGPDENSPLAAYASQIIIPLQSEEKVFGTLNFGRATAKAYTIEDMRIGYLMALQLSLAIRNARTLEELQEAHDQLEVQNVELDAYAHTIAHDLKGPLQPILTYSWVIEAQLGASLPAESLRAVRNINESAMNMARMIDQLLWLARLRNVAESVMVVEIQPVVEAAKNRYETQREARGVQIEIQADLPNVMGHAQWVEEVFANLISNAIKYIGPNNPQPKISVRGKRDGDTVRFAVEDNGLGIAPDEQTRLFEMFTRFHSDTADGIGLGLSIVHRIISKLNGKLGIESEVGKGSTFWFTLPTTNPSA